MEIISKAEKIIGDKCYEDVLIRKGNVKNCEKFLDRYKRMKRDKALEQQKENARELKWN